MSLNGEAGTEIKVSVKITPATKGLFDIVEAKADRGKDIRVTLTESKETDGKSYVLTVENRRKMKGRYRDTIKLLTTSSIRKELTIPVYGNIKARQIAVIKPPGTVMLRGYAGETIKASVTIVPKDKYPFSITEVKPRDGKNIKCDLKEVEESGKKIYVLKVENLKKEKGSYNDMIRLKTDNKDQPEIRISVSARIGD